MTTACLKYKSARGLAQSKSFAGLGTCLDFRRFWTAPVLWRLRIAQTSQ